MAFGSTLGRGGGGYSEYSGSLSSSLTEITVDTAYHIRCSEGEDEWNAGAA